MSAGSIGSDRLTVPGAVVVDRVIRTTSDRLRALRSAGSGSAVRRVNPAIIAVTMGVLLARSASAAATAARQQRDVLMSMVLCGTIAAIALSLLPAPSWREALTAAALVAAFLLPSNRSRTGAPVLRWPDVLLAFAVCGSIEGTALLIDTVGGPPWCLATGLGLVACGITCFALGWTTAWRYLERNSFALRAISICAIISGQSLIALSA